MDGDELFSRLLAPLSLGEDRMVPLAEPAAAPSINLEPGHFLDQHDPQVSFFQRVDLGCADRASLQAMLDPPYHVLPGQTFQLCLRHYLMCDNIIDPPHRWAQLLVENRIFIPWPDVLAADFFHFTAPPVVMVQPDAVLAGLILNYYIARYGADAVVVQ